MLSTQKEVSSGLKSQKRSSPTVHSDNNSAEDEVEELVNVAFNLDVSKQLDHLSAILGMKGNKNLYYKMLSQFRCERLMDGVNEIGNAINYS